MVTNRTLNRAPAVGELGWGVEARLDRGQLDPDAGRAVILRGVLWAPG